MNYDLRKFVPWSIWNQYQERSIMFIDPKILAIYNVLKTWYGVDPIVNNWFLPGGKLHNRGFRTPGTTVGATLSQHKFGRALDSTIEKVHARYVFQDIMNERDLTEKLLEAGATTIEDITFTEKGNWIHLDSRLYTENFDRLIVVKP